MGRGLLMQFPNLSENNVTEDERLKYCTHLDRVRDDMNERFKDLTTLKVPDWVVKPFSADVTKAPFEIQEELIDIQNDEEAKAIYKDGRYDVLWAEMSDRYPGLWNDAKLLVLSFPTSYLVEKGFSAVTTILTKKRNRLCVVERGDLRLKMTTFTPDVKKLTKLSLHA